MVVTLIGYRGSGKTTVGRLLAERLGWGFVDCDERIVAFAGKTIREMFEEEGGETNFRNIETLVVLDLMDLKQHVISLGGGAILRSENRSEITSRSHAIIYLQADPEELHHRIHADTATAANRPALTKLGGGIEEIRSVLAAREPIYRQVMTAEVNVTQQTPEQVVDEILRLPTVR